MSTIETQRAAAGAQYAAAAQAYVEAWVELQAFDLATGSARGFGEMPRALAHGEYFRDAGPTNGSLGDRARARAAALISQFGRQF